VKCINCGKDNNYKERSTSSAYSKCPSCGRRFAFEPKDKDPVTDAAFKSAIDAVSANGQIRWGVEHLYYEVGRRMRRARRWKRRLPWVLLGLVALLLIVALTKGRPVWVVILALIGAAVYRWGRAASSETMALSLDAFNGLWAAWTNVHPDRVNALIVRRATAPRPRPLERDIPLYSFDRAVICDRARTVDLLIANNFHFENNCAVLSAEGYPAGPFETVRAMLKRNPRLKVLVLHDATPAGCQLATKLAGDPAWFKEQVPVIDVGLRPRHAPPFKGLWLIAQGHFVPIGEGVNQSEAAWLTNYALELAAIRPEQVLKRLFKAMNREDDSDSGGGGDGDGGYYYVGSGGGDGGPAASVPAANLGSTGSRSWVIEDSVSFSVEAGDSDGGADAFG